MPIHKIERIDDNTWRLWKDSTGYIEAVVLKATGSPANAAAATAWAQENIFDVRTLLNDLPPTAPERTTDPGRPNYFWLGPGGLLDTYLVSRSVEITVLWDSPDAPGDYTIQLRRLTQD